MTPAVLVADTVGFIRRLPHALVASFQSTLAEAHEAWLLLHVVDASDPAFRYHIDVTTRVLADIGAADTPGLLLLNKADRLGREEREGLAREFAALREQLDVIREDYGKTMVVTVRGTPEMLRRRATRLASG